MENTMLKEQVEELVMVDALTGLYNLRSFYYDIGRQISYAKRNKLPLTLMIVKLRYGQELQNVLSKNQYDLVKQRLVQIVTDAVRIEDRLYSIDKEGGLAAVLTCNETGAALVSGRIHSRVGEKGAFDQIADSSIKIDVKIGYVQYIETMGNDMTNYKKCVEKELQYDV
jgi:GGDEF domain-containing protein